MTAQKLKKCLEENFNKYNKSFSEIQEIKVLKEKEKRAALVVFPSLYDLESVFNLISRKGGSFLNQIGEIVKVN